MKLTTVTNVTVDGVMQGLGAPDEDRRGGFERGGWAGPRWARLFPDAGPDAALELADSRTTPSGVTLQTYRVAGRPRYDVATATPRD